MVDLCDGLRNTSRDLPEVGKDEMPQGRIIIEETRGIPGAVERGIGDPLPRPIDILSELIMMRFISQTDICKDAVEGDDPSCNKKYDPEYFRMKSVFHRFLFRRKDKESI